MRPASPFNLEAPRDARRRPSAPVDATYLPLANDRKSALSRSRGLPTPSSTLKKA
jgi:hypothetical protein